jgi:hypothetical protein
LRAADVVLLVHAGFVLFVVAGWMLVLLGGWRHWVWVRHRGFRCAHLLAIGVVAGQAALGWICPLTTLEARLRERAGDAPAYEISFVQYWVGRLLFYEGDPWVFTTTYIAFFALVVASFWWVPVQWRGRPAE